MWVFWTILRNFHEFTRRYGEAQERNDAESACRLFAAGGFAVLAIGINLLEIKKIRLGSLLPGLIVTPLLVYLFADQTGLLR